MELEGGREFLATKNRRSRRCQELEFRVGVGERSWRWSESPSERIRRIRRGSARRSFRPPTTSEPPSIAIYFNAEAQGRRVRREI